MSVSFKNSYGSVELEWKPLFFPAWLDEHPSFSPTADGSGCLYLCLNSFLYSVSGIKVQLLQAIFT